MTIRVQRQRRKKIAKDSAYWYQKVKGNGGKRNESDNKQRGTTDFVFESDI